MDIIVRQIEDWFASNCRLLSRSFPVLRFSLMQPSDEVRGKISIQVDGPVAGASMTFWNKGDVEVLVLDKLNNATIRSMIASWILPKISAAC